MKKWKGLLIKEWMLMKHWVYTMIGSTVLFTIVLPMIVIFYTELPTKYLGDGFAILAPFWFLFVLFVPTVLLMISLGKESARPDIWLHSPHSVFELFGGKVLFAILTSITNIVLSLGLLLITFSLYVQPFKFSYEKETFSFFLLFSLILFFAGTMIVCVSLLFRVIYFVIRPITKSFSAIITFGLLILYIWMVDVIGKTGFYLKISRFGNFGKVAGKQFALGGEGGLFTIDASFFHAGEILISLGAAILLFIVAAVLFEKKVRL